MRVTGETGRGGTGYRREALLQGNLTRDLGKLALWSHPVDRTSELRTGVNHTPRSFQDLLFCPLLENPSWGAVCRAGRGEKKVPRERRESNEDNSGGTGVCGQTREALAPGAPGAEPRWGCLFLFRLRSEGAWVPESCSGQKGAQGAARPGLSSEVLPSSRIRPSPHAGRRCRETSSFLDVEAARGCERRLAGSTGEHF